MNSKLLNLNVRDLGKGLAVAVLAAILKGVLELLNGGGLEQFGDLQVWLGVGNLAWQVGVAYLAKQLLTDEGGKLGGKL